ncbi:AbrB/MazE/SpoVT family DNA-binding domain-containing protein [Chroococcidiopsis sp. CCMEE 29]|jgi:putative addiction module antidote|uniref:AbrB/MazE/SpoVT family DNA-binding domain-containing protein n=1 Tax=Chroococcidiopsis sp. CCMEE 29 TaxID=155894 RepID=UPI0020204AF0|nr:AbrB/MazE/SpoVT family DNA-binding domain-containing protein [Chroococcidiopsis sp. CCMEE 29]
MDTLKLREIGNSVGVTLPKEYLKHMDVEAGDEVFVTKESDGRLVLSPYDKNFAATMEAYRRVKRRYRNALKELADR